VNSVSAIKVQDLFSCSSSDEDEAASGQDRCIVLGCTTVCPVMGYPRGLVHLSMAGPSFDGKSILRF